MSEYRTMKRNEGGFTGDRPTMFHHLMPAEGQGYSMDVGLGVKLMEHLSLIISA